LALRRFALGGCVSIRVGVEQQTWRQRLAIQGGAVYAPDWREPPDRCGADGRDTGALQLTGDLVAQRRGDIQVSVVHDARRPEEQIAALHPLGLGPIEILERRVGAQCPVFGFGAHPSNTFDPFLHRKEHLRNYVVDLRFCLGRKITCHADSPDRFPHLRVNKLNTALPPLREVSDPAKGLVVKLEICSDITLAKTGGESSYTELLTCPEMSRDVRALNSAAAARSGADVTKRNASSASKPTTRPAPADKASQATPTKEPSTTEAGEPKKDLERAKSDAFNAKASEAVAQRKLADAETALQQVKEEARRATAESERAKAALQQAREETRRATEEVQRSKADAKAARDTEIELERIPPFQAGNGWS
jgi:hypothetical protein